MTAGAIVASLVAVRLTSKTVRWALAVDDRRQAQVVYLPVPRAQVGQFTQAIGA
jgi:predicted acylesterase/phospholipase RssA